MRHALVALAALVLAFAATPGALAAEASGTVYVHDLESETGSYIGCHVTNTDYANYRMTVKEGDSITLTVDSPRNNTNAHALSVDGHDAKTRVLSPGQTATLTFKAGAPKSYAMVCDDSRDATLQGLLIVQKGAAGGKESPGPGALLAALGLAGVALLARRRA